jgi:hypothetical protein
VHAAAPLALLCHELQCRGNTRHERCEVSAAAVHARQLLLHRELNVLE